MATMDLFGDLAIREVSVLQVEVLFEVSSLVGSLAVHDGIQGSEEQVR
jgi:hypothetical protein